MPEESRFTTKFFVFSLSLSLFASLRWALCKELGISRHSCTEICSL